MLLSLFLIGHLGIYRITDARDLFTLSIPTCCEREHYALPIFFCHVCKFRGEIRREFAPEPTVSTRLAHTAMCSGS
ncbi:hypothetical protein V1520DRAFT_339253 [Lipomyces starkeyi]